MQGWKIPAAIFAFSLVLGTVVAVDVTRAPDPRAATSDLFNPRYISANLCNPRAKGRNPFALRFRLAGAAAARTMTTRGGKTQPLWDNLGRHGFKITTASPVAQRYFDQGLRLDYAFNHAEAAHAFRTAQKYDPGCAMCYWGEALVLGPNINAPMDSAAVAPAFAAIAKAKQLAAAGTARERALIDALAKRYAADPGADRSKLDPAYAQALHDVAKRYPADLDIATLYAEALMNLQPWDYWEPNGTSPKGRAREVLDTLGYVLARDPDHAAAIHLYIHVVEASTTPQRALPHAKRLAALMPGAGHIVHMPSHIYYRLGMWRESLDANKKAARADEAYLAQAQTTGIYPDAYYPHNVHFVVTSAQMAGDGKTAVEYARKLGGLVREETMRKVAWVQPIKAAPYFAHAQFSDPATILSLPDPGDAFPFVKAMWRYARAVALARKNDIAAARAEAKALTDITKKGDHSGLTEGGVPAPAVLAIAGQVAAGRIAQATGDHKAAVAAFKRAAGWADSLPYMEPPFWYFPTRQALGAALLMAGDAEGAVQAFRESLVRQANNGWAMWGLARAYDRLGDTAGAAATRALFEKAWVGDAGWLTLDRL